jgi:hypothetical protein
VVPHVLVTVGHHGASPIPPSLSHDVNLRCLEGVCGAYDAADVEVVLPVLDGDVEPMAMSIEVGDDRIAPPVAIAVDDIAAIAGSQKLGVQPGIVRPRLCVRAYTDDVHVSEA